MATKTEVLDKIMEIGMPPSTTSLTARHHLLFQKYFLVLQRIDRFSWAIWVPLFASRWLWFMRIPVLRIAVRVFVSSHIKRVIQALDRAYQLRLAIDQTNPDQDDWKKLHEQAESMDAGLRPFLLSKWVLAILAFVLVFLIGRSLPQGDFAIAAKMIAAAVTLNPEKLAELAAEPGALIAFGRLLVATVLLFIALIPILIYHFRFKRMLFNCPELLPTTELKKVTIATIWKQKSTLAESLYALELDVFIKLGEPVLREIPFDLLALIVVYAFYAVGPGLAVGIIARQVFAVDRAGGRFFFCIATINAAIGLSRVATYIQEINQRSKLPGADEANRLKVLNSHLLRPATGAKDGAPATGGSDLLKLP